MHELIPLQFLAPGQRAEVGQLVGLPADVHRLEELGVRAGSMVEMVQAGSPCIVRLAGNKLCFRDSDGLNILVKLGAAP